MVEKFRGTCFLSIRTSLAYLRDLSFSGGHLSIDTWTFSTRNCLDGEKDHECKSSSLTPETSKDQKVKPA